MTVLRMNKVTIIIGRRGSGKTTFTKKLIASCRHPRILIVDTLDHPSYREYELIDLGKLPRWRKGIKRILINEANVEEVVEQVRTHVHNALVIFEDAGKYIIEKIPTSLRNYVLDTKQINVDILFMYHGVGDVVPRLFRYADHLTLFKINDNLPTYKYKIPSFDLVARTYEKVMKDANPYACKTIVIN